MRSSSESERNCGQAPAPERQRAGRATTAPATRRSGAWAGGGSFVCAADLFLLCARDGPRTSASLSRCRRRIGWSAGGLRLMLIKHADLAGINQKLPFTHPSAHFCMQEHRRGARRDDGSDADPRPRSQQPSQPSHAPIHASSSSACVRRVHGGVHLVAASASARIRADRICRILRQRTLVTPPSSSRHARSNDLSTHKQRAVRSAESNSGRSQRQRQRGANSRSGAAEIGVASESASPDHSYRPFAPHSPAAPSTTRTRT